MRCSRPPPAALLLLLRLSPSLLLLRRRCCCCRQPPPPSLPLPPPPPPPGPSNPPPPAHPRQTALRRREHAGAASHRRRLRFTHGCHRCGAAGRRRRREARIADTDAKGNAKAQAPPGRAQPPRVSDRAGSHGSGRGGRTGRAEKRGGAAGARAEAGAVQARHREPLTREHPLDLFFVCCAAAGRETRPSSRRYRQRYLGRKTQRPQGGWREWVSGGCMGACYPAVHPPGGSGPL